MQHVWERLAHDTTASYARFRDYYLPQPAPRSLSAAYRTYYAERHDLAPDDPSLASKKASGQWQQYARALDRDGQRLTDERGEPALTWEERANAYDDWQAAQERLENRRKRRAIINTAMDKALQALTKMPASGDMREITALLKVALDQSRAEHHDEPDQNVNVRGMVSTVSMTADDMAKARDAVREFEEQLLGHSGGGHEITA